MTLENLASFLPLADTNLDNFSLEDSKLVRIWKRGSLWTMGDRATGFWDRIKRSIVGVLRKWIVREVAIAQRVRLDHVISRGCRQRQMTQLPFHGYSLRFGSRYAYLDVLGPRANSRGTFPSLEGHR